MLISRLVVCVILAVLQLSVNASDMAGELHLLQQQFLRMQQHVDTMQQHMATERQEMHQQPDRQEMQKTTVDEQCLKQQLKEMQNQMETERQEMQWQMANDREELQQQMATARHTVQQQQHKMQQKISNLEQENTKLKITINNINSKVTDVVDENQKLSEVVYVSDMVNKAVSSKHNDTFIGFSAFANLSREYSDGVTVLFDAVITNVGSLYSPGPSVFICGYQGYYLFSLSIRTLAGEDMQAELVMDGTSISSVAYVYADQAEHDSASNTVVVLCPQFNQVYVRAIGEGKRMWGNPSDKASTFTGILLAQQ